MKKWFIFLLLLNLIGCAESAHLLINQIDNHTVILRYNHGALIKQVDPMKAIQEYCSGSSYKILKTTSKQLSGQYRRETSITFKCDGDKEK